ncbi:MAG: tetratricopeptide repeat protein [Hyphomicrobiales bacterium]|nr:tetratricopeptide repeat protein [Hyphomicrobiales bacterium]
MLHPLRFRIFLAATATAFMAGAPLALAREPILLEQPFAVSANPDANFVSALAASHDNDVLAASTFFQEALRANPNDYELMAHTLIAALIDGDIDNGQRLAARLIMHAPDNSLARLVLGVANLKARRFVSARGQFMSIGDKGSPNLISALMAAWSLAGSGKTHDALNLLDTLHDPSFATFRDFHAGLIAGVGKDRSDATTRLASAYKNAPTTEQVADAEARDLAINGHLNQAKAIYQAFLKLAPHNAVMRAALANLGKAGKPEPLVTNATQGAAVALFGLGATAARTGDSGTAIIYLRLAQYLWPDNALVLLTLGDFFLREKQYAEAYDAYDAVGKNDPLRVSADTQIAMIYRATKHEDAAAAKLAAVLKAHPDNFEALVAEGDMQRDKKDYAGSAATFSKALAQDKATDSVTWVDYYSRGVAYALDKQWDKAEPDFKAALKLSPDQPEVLNYLGYSWIERGENYDKAFKMLRRAVDLRPQDGFIVDSLGWAFYKLKRYHEAVHELEKAVQLQPADPLINEHLGDAYWRDGRKIEAHFQWNHARDFNPAPKDLPRILAEIKNGLPDDATPAAPAKAEAPASKPAAATPAVTTPSAATTQAPAAAAPPPAAKDAPQPHKGG